MNSENLDSDVTVGTKFSSYDDNGETKSFANKQRTKENNARIHTKVSEFSKQKSAEYNFQKAQKHWEELGELLNSVRGGSKKTWRQWRKTRTDLKKNTKQKASGLKKYYQGTGGGPAIDDKITEIEKGILEIIGNVMQEGHKEISETPVNFEFNDLSDIPTVGPEIEDNTNLEFI
ncbi:unnamed protein product [Psylliodes chrysocephalus]|uniref:Regulatory protein zeste n=1 Tax=Psylliodes chrysocephalus TaxID=3402493 RepID=A0A9P0CSH6_9CUCU|nr:unnamed protein product [Psylliodes chrysocephala]